MVPKRNRTKRLALTAARTLHLVDAENLAGSACFTLGEAVAVRCAYEGVALPGAGDQFILATSHYAALPAWFAWPLSTRRLVQSGPDGADLALLDVINNEAIQQRFAYIIIGSGDGIFALPAAQLQGMGCAVTVVTRRRGLSKALGLAVRDVRFIDAPSARASVVR